MNTRSMGTLPRDLKTHTSRAQSSTGATILFAFLLFLPAHSTLAAAAPADEATASEPLAPSPDHTTGTVLEGPATWLSYPGPSNTVRLQSAQPEEKLPNLRPASGSGRVIPQVEYLPGPTIKDIGAV
jgi:hypothetical protein